MIRTIEGRKWYCCPHCGKKLFLVADDTVVRRLRYQCKICKHTFEVNI